MTTEEKILSLLKEYSNYVHPEEGDNYKAIDEQDFEELVKELLKVVGEDKKSAKRKLTEK